MKIELNNNGSGWLPPTVDVPLYKWIYYKLTGKRPTPRIIANKDKRSYTITLGGSYDHFIKAGQRIRITRTAKFKIKEK